LGETLTLALNVTENVFSFTSPAPATEIELSPTTQVLTLEWSDGGLSVQDTSVVEFVTNRGDLNGGSLPVQINTVGGVASVTINSDFAGATTITATGLVKDGVVLTDSPSTTLSIEFIATTATTLNVSAFPTTVGINEQTPITAKLYDANGNPVKNKAVLFNITQDPSGGSINPAQVFSDSQGVATSFFQAGGTTTSSNAVEITVNVPDDGLSSSVQLTVALQARNFAIGTGNTLFELTETRYGMPWNITMTDVGGVPVVNSPLQLKLKSINYGKGYWAVVSDPILGLIWAKGAPLYTCDDEDTVVENNSLDTGEDFNGNGTLEAGNIAAIVPLPCDQVTSADITDTQEQVLFTDGAGSVEICVVYGQEYGTWLTTQLTAIAPIQDGTEFSGSRTFLLPVLADDVDDTDEDPPGTRELGFGGVLSPFGRSDCTVGTWP
jgi:hypothetical protein